MYKTILHATDLNNHHYNLCEQSVKLANALGSSLYFLHVIEIPASLQWAHSLGFAELATPETQGAKEVMLALGDAFNIKPDCLLVEVGPAWTHILNKIKELSCDLVIIGSDLHSTLPSYLGSTAHTIIHRAPCDILTLRSSLSND